MSEMEKLMHTIGERLEVKVSKQLKERTIISFQLLQKTSKNEAIYYKYTNNILVL